MNCNVMQPTGQFDLSPELQDADRHAPHDYVSIHAVRDYEMANAFVIGMSNTFTVKRDYQVPIGSPRNLVWVEVGSGSIWRIDPTM